VTRTNEEDVRLRCDGGGRSAAHRQEHDEKWESSSRHGGRPLRTVTASPRTVLAKKAACSTSKWIYRIQNTVVLT